MTVTVEAPPAGEPDAGVIEEARARQRRHRGMAAVAMLAATAVAVLLVGQGGGGGGSHPRSAAADAGRVPSKNARAAPASCASGRDSALQGTPSRSLLSILGVLRRAATATDSGSGIVGRGVVQGVFVHYIRRTRVFDGSPYYIYPAILGGCGTHEKPHEGIMELATHVDLGGGVIGGEGGGGMDAQQIERGESLGTSGLSSTRALVTMIVPDGVAGVTISFPSGRASGWSPKISPPATITTPAVNNQIIVPVPRSSPASAGASMTWQAPDGRTIKRFSRL